MGALKPRNIFQKTPVDTKSGFTIVEVMIVLGVTGLLFISAVVAVAGRQGRTQFQQGINSIKVEIQQVMAEVESGYYPNVSNFSCTVSGVGPTATILINESGSVNQGSNKDCIFAGKVLQFGTGFGVDPERYAVYSLAGKRTTDGKESISSFSQSAAKVINRVTDQRQVPFGLSAVSMTYNNGGGDIPIGAVGFTRQLKQQSNGTMFGSQTTQIIPVRNTNLTSASGTAIDNNIVDSYNAVANPSGGVRICFRSGSTEQSGLITIGGSGRANSVTLSIRENNNCA